jgi:hypothetical protein
MFVSEIIFSPPTITKFSADCRTRTWAGFLSGTQKIMSFQEKSDTTGFRRLGLRRFGDDFNYRFLTPLEKDSEFGIQSSEWTRNGGVKNR